MPGLVVGGLGAGGGIITFLMRAYKTTVPTKYVYWSASGTPDLVGTGSGYPPGDLTDILVVGHIEAA